MFTCNRIKKDEGEGTKCHAKTMMSIKVSWGQLVPMIYNTEEWVYVMGTIGTDDDKKSIKLLKKTPACAA